MSEPAWLTLARADIGITEIKGPKHNARILQMFKDAGFAGIKEDETAWCAAALGSWLKRAGIKPSGSLLARSYEEWGQRLDKPMLGAIGVLRRLNGQAWQGHTGLIVAANPSFVWMVSGNANNRVGIDAYNRHRFTAIRWPFGVPFTELPLPTVAPGATGATEA